MPITRSILEAVIVKRCGKKMSQAGLSVIVNGSNEDLNDPICSALMDLGCDPYNPGEITDGDISCVPIDQISELYDRTELRTLENIAGNLDLVDMSIGPRNENLSQLYDQVEKAIERLTDRIARKYGDTSLTGGTISLDFQAKDL